MANKLTRVVVLLAHGNHCSLYFETREKASKWIKEWADNYNDAENKGKLMSVAYTNERPMGGEVVGCVLMAFVIAAYIVENSLSPAERIATLLEEQNKQGEEWQNG